MAHLQPARAATRIRTLVSVPPLPEPEWRKILATTTHPGKLATVTRHGTPTVVPVWFVLDVDDIVFTTWHESAKAANLRRGPYAALCVDEVRFPYGFVLVRGPVTIDEAPPNLRGWAERIASRYVPPGRAAEYGERNGVPGEWLCRLRIERILAQGDIAA
jgi:PPOX class probable F420-dependent enzyme